MEVLMFHRVLPKSLINEHDAYYLRGTLVSTDYLISVIEKYLILGFEFQTLNQALENISAKTIVLTFDDCYDDCYRFVYPILTKYSIKATFYPTIGYCLNRSVAPLDYYYHFINLNVCLNEKTDWITGMKKKEILKYTIAEQEIYVNDLYKNNLPKIGLHYMTGSNLIEVYNSGHEIGGHSLYHDIYTCLNMDEVKSDFQSMMSCFNELAISIETFAYTDGRYNNNIIELLVKEGIKGACTIKSLQISNNSKFEIQRHFCN
jgi:hypothetical protein